MDIEEHIPSGCFQSGRDAHAPREIWVVYTESGQLNDPARVRRGLLGVGSILVMMIGLLLAGLWLGLKTWRRAANVAGQALLQATEAGDVPQMQALLAKNVNLQARNAYGWTSLHLAAAGGDVTVVQLLLQHGADVHARTNVGTTPLYHAMVQGGRRAVVDLLLAHGATAEPSWGMPE